MIEVYAVSEYSTEIAAGIGLIMPDLSSKFSSEPMDEAELREIIESPFHDQLVAEAQGKIVGAATMNLILGTRKAWLENFVVSESEDVRGKGVGFELWKGIIGWSHDHHAKSLEFTSNKAREAAHKFYIRQGVKINDTTPFKLELIS